METTTRFENASIRKRRKMFNINCIWLAPCSQTSSLKLWAYFSSRFQEYSKVHDLIVCRWISQNPDYLPSLDRFNVCLYIILCMVFSASLRAGWIHLLFAYSFSHGISNCIEKQCSTVLSHKMAYVNGLVFDWRFNVYTDRFDCIKYTLE